MILTNELKSLQNDLATYDLFNRNGRGPFLEILIKKYENLKFKMYQEKSHSTPHFHIDYGSNNHIASFSINDGCRIEGNLPTKYDRIISKWINENKDKLLDIWNHLQAGEPYEELIPKSH